MVVTLNGHAKNHNNWRKPYEDVQADKAQVHCNHGCGVRHDGGGTLR